jgi:uncharacterized protein (TIGR02246 family)
MRSQTEEKMMKTTKVIVAPSLLLSAGLLVWSMGANAQQPKPEQPAKARQLSEADEKAIRDILKDQETAWNKHDMKAFTKAFRDDAEGINVVGMYWRGKPAILKHLVDFHATFLKDCQEYLEEVQVHSVGEGHAVAVNIWKVDAFKGPGGHEIPACRHRSTVALAKGKDGWEVVHFHNTTIDEAVVKAAAAPRKDGSAEDDLKALQGTWVTLKLVSDGKVEVDLKEPPKEGPVSTLSYDGHKWVLKLGDKKLASGTSKLDSSKTPKHIDLTHVSGPLKGQTVLGIYKLVGDEYAACIAAVGKERPSEFSSKEGSGYRLVVSKREKR